MAAGQSPVRREYRYVESASFVNGIHPDVLTVRAAAACFKCNLDNERFTLAHVVCGAHLGRWIRRRPTTRGLGPSIELLGRTRRISHAGWHRGARRITRNTSRRADACRRLHREAAAEVSAPCERGAQEKG